jgi:hypothetical protein
MQGQTEYLQEGFAVVSARNGKCTSIQRLYQSSHEKRASSLRKTTYIPAFTDTRVTAVLSTDHSTMIVRGDLNLRGKSCLLRQYRMKRIAESTHHIP